MNQETITNAFKALTEALDVYIQNITIEQETPLEPELPLSLDEKNDTNNINNRLEYFKKKADGLYSEWDDFTSPHRAPDTRLRIKFPDGKIIEESSGAKSFVSALQDIGIDRVRNLKMTMGRNSSISLFSKERSKGRIKLEDWYVFTNTNTEKKKEILERIAAKLKLEIQVEIIQ